MYVIWVDEGDGWYIYKETDHWPDVQKALDSFDYCYYDYTSKMNKEEK